MSKRKTTRGPCINPPLKKEKEKQSGAANSGLDWGRRAEIEEGKKNLTILRTRPGHLDWDGDTKKRKIEHAEKKKREKKFKKAVKELNLDGASWGLKGKH